MFTVQMANFKVCVPYKILWVIIAYELYEASNLHILKMLLQRDVSKIFEICFLQCNLTCVFQSVLNHDPLCRGNMINQR